jgi:hypothetical protein
LAAALGDSTVGRSVGRLLAGKADDIDGDWNGSHALVRRTDYIWLTGPHVGGGECVRSLGRWDEPDVLGHGKQRRRS